MEMLLGLPPMNQNDAYAPAMGPMFSGEGKQAAFEADYRNLKNGLIYERTSGMRREQVNRRRWISRGRRGGSGASE